MKVCKHSHVLRNSAWVRARTSAFSPAHVLLARFTSPAVDSVAAVASDSNQTVSTLLRKTASLLPRTLSTADSASGPVLSVLWSSILEGSITELCSRSDQTSLRATIAVCGFDKWAGSHDLVTALLEDPFSFDPAYTDILRNRWKDAPSRINVEYGKPAAFAGELSSPSNWLRGFPHPIRFTEFPDLSSFSSVSDDTSKLLLNSDVLLLLCDPVVTPFSDLVARAGYLLDKPNTILVLTSGSDSNPHRQFVSQTLSKMGCQPGHILFVNPRRALDAVTALQANPSSPSAIDKYQREALGSRLSTITTAINEVLGPENPSKTSLVHLRLRTALSQVHGSLSASFRSIESTKGDVELVASKIDVLSSRVREVRENAIPDILGKPGAGNEIEEALSLSTKKMDTLLGSLTFWKTVWHVDEIGALVSAAVHEQWCKGLESQLILHTGRLESVKQGLSVPAFGLASASSLASLRSPILENKLEQLKRLPAHALTPNSLTQPIHDRRSQLVQYTTIRLHREAQSAVVGAFGCTLSGACLGWWLALGEHALSLGAGTEIGTAIGSGALLAMIGVRWAVGKWERAKRRWGQDSKRIGEGLARDLQSTIQRTVDGNVTIVASTACEGMRGLVDRCHDEIRQLHGELCDLKSELDACGRFPATRTGVNPPSVREINRE